MTEILKTTTVATPLGNMQVIASDRGLCFLEFVKPDRQKLLKLRLKRWFPSVQLQAGEHAVFKEVREWLGFYFRGEFSKLPKLALDPRGTAFEKNVWREMQRLELGKTMSYAQLAAKVGSPRGARAAGNASRRNPMALVVPCHRIIGANGDLTGYGGGLHHKEWLIEHELQAERAMPPCTEG